MFGLSVQESDVVADTVLDLIVRYMDKWSSSHDGKSWEDVGDHVIRTSLLKAYDVADTVV